MIGNTYLCISDYIIRIMDILKYHLFFLVAVISVYTLIIFVPIDAYADEFANISAINITKEDGTTVSIDPDFLVKDASEVINNTNAKENQISLAQGENIDIYYTSPCGFAESIEGLLLKGNAEMSVRSFSSASEVETLNLTGEQIEFFKNQSPQEEAVEIAVIPDNLEVKSFIDNQDSKNKLVFIIDCDEEKIYYISEVEII